MPINEGLAWLRFQKKKDYCKKKLDYFITFGCEDGEKTTVNEWLKKWLKEFKRKELYGTHYKQDYFYPYLKAILYGNKLYINLEQNQRKKALENLSKAIKYYSEAHKKNPLSDDVCSNIAALYGHLDGVTEGKFIRSDRWLKWTNLTLSLNSSNIFALYNLAVYNWDKKNFIEAEKWFKKLALCDELYNHKSFILHMGDFYARRPNYEAALKCFQVVATTEPLEKITVFHEAAKIGIIKILDENGCIGIYKKQKRDVKVIIKKELSKIDFSKLDGMDFFHDIDEYMEYYLELANKYKINLKGPRITLQDTILNILVNKKLSRVQIKQKLYHFDWDNRLRIKIRDKNLDSPLSKSSLSQALKKLQLSKKIAINSKNQFYII